MRDLIRTLFLMLIVIHASLCGGHAQKITLGMATALENDSLLYNAGFRLIGTTVENLISPKMTDSVFARKVEIVKNMHCKLIMCNVLFPGSIKIAGPEADENKVLSYLESVLRRANAAGVPNLILGSGGARRLPEGYDKKRAMDDFVLLTGKMAALASKYNVRIILENLNSTETNFLTTLHDAAEVVRRVNHPNLRLNADIYHMMKEDEPAAEIVRAGKLIVYCEIAEKEGRTLPGVSKQDFSPYLKSLKQIGFSGPIIIEGNIQDLRHDVPQAFEYLTAQLRAAGFGN
jgi:sugar phosphate isomerase/epimerase